MADNYYYSSSSQSQPTLTTHLCFFLLVLFAFVGFTWYVNFESIFGSIFDGIKLFIMVSPLLLVVAVQLLAFLEKFWIYVPFTEQESFHRAASAGAGAGETPWGVALLLVILFFMVSYQSDLRERWFPLLS